jgi:NADPH:quinone reductase-like Zn-dependent oxidoreductase
MEAAVFEKPGLDNLKITDNVELPKISDHDILIKVKMAGVNPIDSFVVSGALPKINPLPHIPGAESTGIVEEVGSHVNSNNDIDTNIKKGDRLLDCWKSIAMVIIKRNVVIFNVICQKIKQKVN